jgi:hypothetical protein
MNHNRSSPPKFRHVAEERVVVATSYILSFESARYFRGCRVHWMIRSVEKPDELVSWGYAPTLELAKVAADSEINKLELGLSETGRVRRHSRIRSLQR